MKKSVFPMLLLANLFFVLECCAAPSANASVKKGENSFKWSGKLEIDKASSLSATFTPTKGKFDKYTAVAAPIDDKAWTGNRRNTESEAKFSATFTSASEKAYPTSFDGLFQPEGKGKENEKENLSWSATGLLSTKGLHDYIEISTKQVKDNPKITINGKDRNAEDAWKIKEDSYTVSFTPSPDKSQKELLETLTDVAKNCEKTDYAFASVNPETINSKAGFKDKKYFTVDFCCKDHVDCCKSETECDTYRARFVFRIEREINLTLVMPVWPEVKNANQETQKLWENVMKVIRTHEERHWQDFKNYFDDPVWDKWAKEYEITICVGQKKNEKGGPYALDAIEEQLDLIEKHFVEDLELAVKRRKNAEADVDEGRVPGVAGTIFLNQYMNTYFRDDKPTKGDKLTPKD